MRNTSWRVSWVQSQLLDAYRSRSNENFSYHHFPSVPLSVCPISMKYSAELGSGISESPIRRSYPAQELGMEALSTQVHHKVLPSVLLLFSFV